MTSTPFGRPSRGARAGWLAPVALVTLVGALAAWTLSGRPGGGPQAQTTTASTTPPPAAATPAPSTSTAPALPSPTATPIPEPLRQEVIAAYQRYWQVLSDARWRLDAGALPQVLADPALERERQFIADLQTEGRAAVTWVSHSFRVVSADDVTALVYDEFSSRSYPVDPSTKEPLFPTPDAGVTRKLATELRKIDGTWKVVDGERYD